MNDAFERPRLRTLQVFPAEQDGKRVLCLRDPEGITDAVAVLPPALAVFLLETLDGDHELLDIQAEYTRRSGGRILPREDLLALVRQLDQALLLDGPAFSARLEEIRAEFRAAPARPAALAGSAYPSEPAELVEFLDGFGDGFGAGPDGALLRAVAVPHLDPQSGGVATARGLKGLTEAFRGDTVVVLGTGHHLGLPPFALTGKDYETPLGTVPVDRDLLDRVVAKAGSWVLDEEVLHRSEHSAEFAAVFLRHALGDREFRILPVLCGSFHRFLEEGTTPREDPLVGAFLETLAEEAPDALLYASVDFAHMGPYYGDREPLTGADLESIERDDRRMLALMAARDAEGFFDHFRRDRDRRRVCGLSAIYSLLALLPPGPEGRLAAYEQPVFPAEGNTVTIGAMTWAR
jgi:AmmeMemoRadiSam system protein B